MLYRYYKNIQTSTLLRVDFHYMHGMFKQLVHKNLLHTNINNYDTYINNYL